MELLVAGTPWDGGTGGGTDVPTGGGGSGAITVGVLAVLRELEETVPPTVGGGDGGIGAAWVAPELVAETCTGGATDIGETLPTGWVPGGET